MMPMTKEKPLARLADAARTCGVSYWVLWDCVNKGDVPFVPRGRHVYVKIADVERWLETRGRDA